MINYIYDIAGIIGVLLLIAFAVRLYIRFSHSSYKNIESALADQQFEKAKRLCLSRIDNQPNDFVIKYYLGQALEGLRDFPGAILYYEKAAISASSVENENLKTQIHLKTAFLLKKTHNEKEALGYFALVLDREPMNARALFACAEVYFELKVYEKARQLLQTHLSIKPDHINSRFLLAQVDMILRRFPEVIEQLEYIIENEVSGDDIVRPKSLAMLSEAYLEIKNLNKAKNALEELMKYENYYEDAVIKMIRIKIRTDDNAQTVAFIEQNLDNLGSANRSLALYDLGSIYYNTGRYYEAIDVWRRAYEINPGNRDLQKMINHYSMLINNQGLKGLYTGDDKEAESFIKKLIKNDQIIKIIKLANYWAVHAGEFLYVVYRVPRQITAPELAEIKDEMGKSFSKSNCFTLYSLYGFEYTPNSELNNKDITLVSQKDLISLVNSFI
jgi:tetratricopeptide (TPR) repeat protein